MIYVVGNGLLAEVIANCLTMWACDVTHVYDPDNNDLVFRPIDLVWMAHDVEVDVLGFANMQALVALYEDMLARLPGGLIVLVSSQVPVGFTRELEKRYPHLAFGVFPENLRRAHATYDFLTGQPIVGTRSAIVKERIGQLFHQRLKPVEWVSPEDAEMSKHVRNAFLALSITFGNEMAEQSRRAGADYAAVLRIVKQDPRIGQDAYLNAGNADGRHLLRDVRYLLAHTQHDTLLHHIQESDVWDR